MDVGVLETHRRAASQSAYPQTPPPPPPSSLSPLLSHPHLPFTTSSRLMLRPSGQLRVPQGQGVDARTPASGPPPEHQNMGTVAPRTPFCPCT